MQASSNLRALRLALVDADRDLDNARDKYTILLGTLLREGEIKIKSTTREARDQEIAGLFGYNSDYLSLLARVRHAEWQRNRTEALLEAAKDDRRKEEWQI